MVIKAKRPPGMGVEIDLSGSQGNAFYLLGTAKQLALALSLDPEPILKEMQAGDYEHLIATFDRHFGDFVTLYRGDA